MTNKKLKVSLTKRRKVEKTESVEAAVELDVELTTPRYEGKIPLLLFSGGLDSTYLLWCLLQESPVDVLYLNGGQCPIKMKAEELTRERILSYLTKHRPYQVQCEYTDDQPTTFMMGNQISFSQPVPWLMGALRKVDSKQHSKVCIAYVMNDDIMVHRHDLILAWDALNRICKTESTPLELTLWNNKKEWFIKDMPVELSQMTWSCEMPRYSKRLRIKACGRCIPCQHRKPIDKLLRKMVKEVNVEELTYVQVQ
jgi:7-cyano-7-deazaguanine synthase in queuosine biosynthesis